ncbi:HAD family hydrolase [Natronobacterium gregoryi]|uniref:HAD family hydrolase n=2 Tax=Natronobacterium gregoryi TaxID=44930 RepID=L0AGQ9_NATGS|nr:HAD family hydrolase [Natronobacterium gregoryi]AFZ72265.1 haloacid dehalogenase superfamily enzyme, subfamily IA [Natronobacterium gregoryi SP2]ELY62335.1 HAD-superfamily hydrolase, subfamily IA, variant 3 [Natronobacterium gregoryi SP2]PLK20213.1 HAD family hydrolase [Natronobacterium gregoryi SP2]SFJ29184.1 putative hydrolase of the HAD superfamily [Natronobacterium gregoryi]
MADYDAICFDLDRTLCESTQDPGRLLESAFDRAGLEQFCTPADLRAALPSLPVTETDREFYESLFREAANRAGVDPETREAAVSTLSTAYLELRDPTAVEFRPGAETALEHAHDRGRVGLITNGGRKTQSRKLRTLGIEHAFDVRVFTEPSAGIYPKPNAEPFEYALGELGVDPANAIHVGDSPHADVAGANAMGIDSALVGVADPSDHQPTYELSSLARLESIV